MLDLSSYLQKFTTFRNPGEKKAKIASLILETSSIEVKQEEIQLKNQTLFIKGSSITKSEIFLNKEELLKVLNERLDEKITDIR
jgi:hypothetical protein